METLFALAFSLLTISTPSSRLASENPADGPTPAASKSTFAAAVFPAANQSKIWLHLQKFEPSAKVNVELLDENGALMFRETLPARCRNKNNTYRQQFDLSQLTDGRYTLRLSSGGHTEKRAITLNTTRPVPEGPVRMISMK